MACIRYEKKNEIAENIINEHWNLFAQELSGFFQYSLELSHTKPLKNIFLTGLPSVNPKLKCILEEAFNLDVIAVDPLRKINIKDSRLGTQIMNSRAVPILASSRRIGLEGNMKHSKRMNLIPKNQRAQLTLNYDQLVIILAITIITIIGSNFLLNKHSHNSKTLQLKVLSEQLQSLQKQVSVIQSESPIDNKTSTPESMAGMAQILKNKSVWAAPFKEISGLIPEEKSGSV